MDEQTDSFIIYRYSRLVCYIYSIYIYAYDLIMYIYVYRPTIYVGYTGLGCIPFCCRVYNRDPQIPLLMSLVSRVGITGLFCS